MPTEIPTHLALETPAAMPSEKAHPTLCAHIAPGATVFELVLVLDDAAGPTDAVVRCRHCGAHWLLEMLDWLERERLMRMTPLNAKHTQTLIANLERGSCDIRRAGVEAASVFNGMARLQCLIAIDARDFSVTRLLRVPKELTLPAASWRSLPCTGRWFELADGLPPVCLSAD
jgi:hypothetical protein